MRVAISHRSIVPRDAIGSDIAGMVDELREVAGCSVHGELVMLPNVPVLDDDGIAVPPADPENLSSAPEGFCVPVVEFSAALEVLLRSPACRDWLVERGQANFAARFTRDHIARAFRIAIAEFAGTTG